jgi:hypothetical protein
MIVDLLIYLFIGFAQLATAIYGGVVSAKSIEDAKEKQRDIIIFVGLGIIGFVLIVVSGVRLFYAQIDTQRQQSTLQKRLDETGADLKTATEDLKTAKEKLDQSLAAQSNMDGQLKSLQLMVSNLGKAGLPGMEALARSIQGMNQSNQSQAAETSQHLCQKALDKAQAIRSFQNQFEESTTTTLMSRPNNQNPSEFNRMSQNIADAERLHTNKFMSDYVGDAKYLKDSMAERLTVKQRDSLRDNNTQADMVLNYGEKSGARDEMKVALYLEQIAKTLCPAQSP